MTNPYRPLKAWEEGQPPNNVTLEQNLIGIILFENRRLFDVDHLITKDDFYFAEHQLIYARARALIIAGQLASPITMRRFSDSLPQFRAKDGKPPTGGQYLVYLVGNAVSSYALVDYARALADLSGKRKLQTAMAEATDRIEADEPTSEIAEKIEVLASNIGIKTGSKRMVMSAGKAARSLIQQVQDVWENGEKAGVTTGIPGLDRKLGYLRAGNFVTLGGRTSMGKTTAALSIARAAIAAGHGVWFQSLEMTGEELMARVHSLLQREIGKKIPYNDILQGKIENEQAMDIARVTMDELDKWPLIITERNVRNIEQLRPAARRASFELSKLDKTLDLIVVDYVQLLQSDNHRSSYDRASAASDACKTIAQDLAVPILGLVQLNRTADKRDDPRPQLSDIRESGKLEEDSDAVIFVYRESKVIEKAIESTSPADVDAMADLQANLAACRGQIDFIVAKNRHGPTGTVTAWIEEEFNFIHPERPFDPYEQEETLL